MADELFNVIFRGDIAPGQTLPDVKARFAQLFKLDAAKLEAYFTGKPVVLKKECDRATADKFKAVLQQAGALVNIKSAIAAVAAPVATSSPIATPPAATSVTAAPVAATPAVEANTVQSASEGSWSLSPRGADLLKPEEVRAPAPVNVSIDHIAVAKRNPFAADAEAPLEAARDAEAPQLDLSAYQLGKVGEALVEFQDFVPRDLDLSALTLDALGANLLPADEQLPVMGVAVDLSGLQLAPPGGDLGQIAPPVAPAPPSTDHLSLDRSS